MRAIEAGLDNSAARPPAQCSGRRNGSWNLCSSCRLPAFLSCSSSVSWLACLSSRRTHTGKQIARGDAVARRRTNRAGCRLLRAFAASREPIGSETRPESGRSTTKSRRARRRPSPDSRLASCASCLRGESVSPRAFAGLTRTAMGLRIQVPEGSRPTATNQPLCGHVRRHVEAARRKPTGTRWRRWTNRAGCRLLRGLRGFA